MQEINIGIKHKRFKANKCGALTCGDYAEKPATECEQALAFTDNC